MKVKPGCGCAVLVLGVFNFLVALTLVWSIVTDPVNVGLSLLMLGVFVANIFVCVMFGLPAIRRSGMRTADTTGGDEAEDLSEAEGESQ